MKKMYTNRSRGIVTGVLLLLGTTSFAQTFYSKFPDVTGKFQVSNPSGSECTAPRVQNKVGMVDEYDTSYTYFTTTITAPLVCTTPTYSFDAALNLPADTPYVGSGFKAGFRIRVPTGINIDTLRKYITISTYKDNMPEEEYTGAGLSGSDSVGNGVDWYVYFTASKAFNALNMLVDESIIPLNIVFQFDILYAEATFNTVLPATLTNFTLATSGSNVNLSWQSLTETNVSSYSVQRSSNSGVTYLPVATIPAKGNSGAAVTYTYTDKVAADGNYLYRIVTQNSDGSSKATYSITASISGQAKLFIYPSVVKAGQTVTITTSQTGLATLQLFTAEGRLVSRQRQNADTPFKIATGGLSAGMYWVKLTFAEGSSLASKIMVE